MLSSNRLYYRLKPYLPWRLRMGVRRIVARRQRQAYKDTWPINETAGQKPNGWPGWPDGKKFALVLTHDVEGQRGLDKCRQLMELEQKYGFRSSFNFIPEGEYQTSRELREELAQNGFEVGVHDLRHDGKLYWKRSEFPENARSINHYLKEWNASGFRSGFMLHNRECLNGLDIEYDASTFDTDPFEPQPEGVNTIFPFWVPRPDGSGYVELPYTLPQDSTMFLVLEETSPEIWKKKLAWIVQRGGMVLLNVHPDYVGFKNGSMEISEYPSAFYEDFLKHIAENYKGAYWNALPKEIAGWYKEKCLPKERSQAVNRLSTTARTSSLKGMNAAVVLYSYYATDPRPRREAEALIRAGMNVDVICLRRDSSTGGHENVNGVNVFRMPLRRRRASKLVYMMQYAWFLICSFLFLSVLGLKKRYKLIHVHNMPDFLVFSALLPRLRGAKVILDLHDPMPELFCSIYGLPKKHFIVRWLEKMEKRSIAFADMVLTPNIAFKELFTSRSCPAEKIETVMNSPDTAIFNPDKYPPAIGMSGQNGSRPFTLMYHGLLVERHGLDLAIQAIAQLRARIPNIKLHMYGEPTDYLEKIMEMVRKLNLESAVQFYDFKPLNEIAETITKIDLGLIPNRLSSFTQINFPTRIFEYLAMNKPVIVPSTRGIRDYFNNDEILFFEAGNSEDLAKKIEWAYQHPSELQALMEKGREVYKKNCWDLEERRLVGQVDNLVHRL
jgi:glycosyltransferase involved in cell wall biosynthesis/peptidoglycan/xylan/chitin deacetylase (PgdA/CDA1 family)